MRIEQKHIDIMDYIARRRFVTMQHLSLGLGLSKNSLIRPLSDLRGNRFISREEPKRNGLRGGREPFVYRIEARGIEELKPLESVSPRRFQCLQGHAKNESRAHALMISDFLAKAEASARNHPRRTFLDPYEIKRELFQTPKQLVWSVNTTFKGEERPITLIADETFGISHAESLIVDYYFLEADRGTMPINPKSAERSSLARKVAAYHASFEQGLYQKHFGFKSVRVVFVVPTEARRESLVDLCSECGAGRGIFLMTDEDSYNRHDSIFEIPFVSGSRRNRRIT